MPRRLRPAAALAATALLLAGCTGTAPGGTATTGPEAPSATATARAGVPAGLERYYDQQVSWAECGAHDCAEIEVPLDYAEPDGRTVTLALERLPATGDGRNGSLLVNPGGPGGSGTDIVSSLPQMLGEGVLKSYDAVGFDPRGVEDSTAVNCVSDAELDTIRSATYDLETDAGVRAYLADAARIGEGCAENTGDLLGHVDTVSAARDLDVIRHVLGDDRLHYLGYSYGTELGATYAELFPERVGRLVLDGGLDPTLSVHEMTLDQARGFEAAMRAYVADCQAGPDCPLTGGVDGGMAQVRTLLELTEDTPMPTSDADRPLTSALAISGILLPLYESRTWQVLTVALTQAMEENDGSQLLFLADLMAGREADGSYSTNSLEANWAINCLDDPGEGDLAQWKEEAVELEEVAPTFGPALSFGGALCSDWPVSMDTPAPQIRAEGADPIMVIGTTGDPATPYAWSQALAEQLASGFLVTFEGQGHTAYGRSNPCIGTAVDDFLLDGTVPAEGLTC